MILAATLTLLFAYKDVLCITLTQSSTDQTVASGTEVTLLCTYNADSPNPDLFWYRKRPDRSFQFILYRDDTSSHDADFVQGRFSVKHSKANRTFHLVISPVSLEDSATYYCASGYIGGIRATDKLVFGQGTQVTVEPKSQPPAKPSVFIMKNGTNVACLVKDFYPKEVTISLRSSKKIVEFDPAIVISPSGKYSAVKLGQYGDSNSVTCSVQHNSETVHSTDFEPYANSFNNEKLPEPENDTQISEPCYGPRVTVHTEKVNMMSLTVLGLRLLFAKTIAINFLLTVKLFF